MKEIVKAELWVNKIPVDLNAFTEEFLARTVIGAVSTLRGADNIKNLELVLDKGELSITVNGNDIPLTPFPAEIMTAMAIGLVSSLKGVDKIDGLKVAAKVGS